MTAATTLLVSPATGVSGTSRSSSSYTSLLLLSEATLPGCTSPRLLDMAVGWVATAPEGLGTRTTRVRCGVTGSEEA
ncbi:hypothetical protein GW7_09938 [Heterocephalus glaber]|uniref:Uncharacterized protein n=1 Tax=Heterocephalus glaber TaxID=10181 RepID=G5BJ28_HETGA|nr:hypothetical protein GW7_09938 [Heterocephalus glaber]